MALAAARAARALWPGRGPPAWRLHGRPWPPLLAEGRAGFAGASGPAAAARKKSSRLLGAAALALGGALGLYHTVRWRLRAGDLRAESSAAQVRPDALPVRPAAAHPVPVQDLPLLQQGPGLPGLPRAALPGGRGEPRAQGRDQVLLLQEGAHPGGAGGRELATAQRLLCDHQCPPDLPGVGAAAPGDRHLLPAHEGAERPGQGGDRVLQQVLAHAGRGGSPAHVRGQGGQDGGDEVAAVGGRLAGAPHLPQRVPHARRGPGLLRLHRPRGQVRGRGGRHGQVRGSSRHVPHQQASQEQAPPAGRRARGPLRRRRQVGGSRGQGAALHGGPAAKPRRPGGVRRAAGDGGAGGLRRPHAAHTHRALVPAGGAGHRRRPPRLLTRGALGMLPQPSRTRNGSAGGPVLRGARPRLRFRSHTPPPPVSGALTPPPGPLLGSQQPHPLVGTGPGAGCTLGRAQPAPLAPGPFAIKTRFACCSACGALWGQARGGQPGEAASGTRTGWEGSPRAGPWDSGLGRPSPSPCPRLSDGRLAELKGSA